MSVGSVCDLRHVKDAITTARAVMDHTIHTTLSGLQATAFALEMGLKLTNLSTPASSNAYYSWWALAKLAMHGQCFPIQIVFASLTSHVSKLH